MDADLEHAARSACFALKHSIFLAGDDKMSENLEKFQKEMRPLESSALSSFSDSKQHCVGRSQHIGLLVEAAKASASFRLFPLKQEDHRSRRIHEGCDLGRVETDQEDRAGNCVIRNGSTTGF